MLFSTSKTAAIPIRRRRPLRECALTAEDTPHRTTRAASQSRPVSKNTMQALDSNTRPLRHAAKRGRVFKLIATCTPALLATSATRARADGPDAVVAAGTYSGGGGPRDTSVDAATGTVTTTYPLIFPPARGEPQPLLGLSYVHTAGLSEVGMGWSLNLPAIERHGLASGPPLFEASDPYVYELSGVSLVRVCVVTGSVCAGTPVPQWASPAGSVTWTMYRPATDAAYTRVFQRSDGKTWRVQQRSGLILEFGEALIAPAANSGDSTGGMDQNPDGATFRWKLVRQMEAYASTSLPKNIIVYAWRHEDFAPKDVSRLTDIYYTPAASANTGDTSIYAHHIHLSYTNWRSERLKKLVHTPIWKRRRDYIVERIDVASKGLQSSREQVRRYHLQYRDQGGTPYLESVLLQGRCAAPTLETPQTEGRYTSLLLPPSSPCPTFAPGISTYVNFFRHHA